MENHSKYGESVFYHNDTELFVNQFIASELTWEEKGISIIQETNYPDEQGTSLIFSSEKPTALLLHIRYPYWAENGMEVRINGKKYKHENEPSSFVTIDRKWKDGDRVDVSFPFNLRIESMPDDANRVAIMYGPLVLAGQLGPEDDPEAKSPMYVPVILSEKRDPSDWLKPVDGNPNAFVMSGVGRPRDVELKPFYSTHEERYTIYWDLFTEKGWEEKKVEYAKKIEHDKYIQEITIDFVQPGEMQPERNHKFEGENTSVGGLHDRKMRETRGGWFSYVMTGKAYAPVDLLVEYWGGYPGKKTFDILVEGEVIATQNISNIKDGSFIEIKYTVPEEITHTKNRITVTFKAHEGNIAGPVFGLRTLFRTY